MSEAPAPRPVPTSALYLERPVFWPGLLLLVVGLTMGSVGLWHLFKDHRLNRGGVTTTAQIDNAYTTSARRRDGGISYRHYLDVSFRDEAGHLHSAVFHVSQGFYNESRGRSGVELRYLASNPAVSELEPGLSRWLGSILGLIGATILWLGLLLLGKARGQVASRRRAVEAGEARDASVTEIRPWGKKASGKARLHWRDESGLTGTSVPRPVASLPPPGRPVTIYIDPQDGRGYWSGEY